MTTTPTAAQFRSRAERMFRTANSDVAATATIEWVRVSRPYTGANRCFRWRTGTFIAAAPGYRPRQMTADLCITDGSMSVR